MKSTRSLRAALLASAVALGSAGGAVACIHPEFDDVAGSQKETTPDLAAQYVGLSIADAEAMAAADGRMFRIVKIDGEAQIITKDYRVGRINAEVANGRVVAISVEGAPSS